MLVIGIYARKSVYRDTSESVATQIKLCKEYSRIMFRGQELDFIVYGKDEGFTGFNMNRPSFKEMMQDVENGVLNVVMVYRLDRISRNVPEFSQIFDRLQKNQVSFVSVKESFDTSTPIGRTVMYILAAFAQLERDTTSERVSDNMDEMALHGFWTGGKCPAGTTSIKRMVGNKEHSFLILDNNIDYVRNLYSLMLSGLSITALERHCKNHGIKSLTGKFLNTSQLYFILTNPVYCQNAPEALEYFREKENYKLPDNAEALFDGKHGLIAYGRYPQSKQASGIRKPITIAVGIHDYAITAQDWISVQNRLGENKQVRASKYELGILKGVLRCSCGHRMITKIYNQKGIQYRNYLCSVRDRMGKEYCSTGHIRLDEVDDMFLQRLKALQLDKSLIQIKDYAPPEEFDERAAKTQISELEVRIENLTRTLQDNQDAPAAKYIVRQIDRLDGEINALRAEIQRSKLQTAQAKDAQNAIDYVYSQICYLLEQFETLSYREKNELIRRIVKECVFENGNLKIVF